MKITRSHGPFAGILAASVIAVGTNCQGQSNVYTLNVVSYYNVPIYDSYHECCIGPWFNQLGLRDYRIGSVRTVEFVHTYTNTAIQGFTADYTRIVELRARPFRFWISPWLIGWLATLGLTVSLPLVAAFTVKRGQSLAGRPLMP